MAKFLVTSGSKFTPFSYDDLVKPLAQMAEAHATTQTALDTLALEAGTLGSQIGEGEDTERSRKMYNDYMQQLQATADELYQNGYGAAAMRGLSRARTMYGTDMTKIQQAITQRNARADEYRKALAANPTLITEYNPLTKGLDNWLDNPQYGYYQSYSGETLINQGKLVGENLRKEMLRDEQTWRPVLGDQYFERIVRSGYTSDELSQAMSDVLAGRSSTVPAIAALEQAISQIYNSTGMDSWASPEQRNRAMSFIGQGMSAAVGELKRETQQNHDHMTPYQRASISLQERHQKLEEDKFKAQQDAAGTGTGYITPTQPVNSTAEKAKAWASDKTKYFKTLKNGQQPVKTQDGSTLTVHDWKEATSLVYNAAARNKGFEIFNFDVALDPMDWVQSTNSRQYGKTVLNGKEYNVRTGPAERNGWASGVNNNAAIYVEVAPGRWQLHNQLTSIYNGLRQDIERSKEYYKTNYKDVYDAALSPSEENTLREKYEVPSNVSMSGLSDAIDASPLVAQRVTNEIILAQSGDNGKAVREQLLSQLATNYNNLQSEISNKQIKRSPSYSIKPVNNGVIELHKKGKSYSDVFKQDDKKNTITNVTDIRVTPESIRNNMFIVSTTSGEYAVPVEMFGSASIAYTNHMKDLGTTINWCLDNAAYLANASVDDDYLIQAAAALTEQINPVDRTTGQKVYRQVVNPADLCNLVATSTGRDALRKWYQQAIMTSVPVLLGETVRFSRFPAASLTASKDPQ